MTDKPNNSVENKEIKDQKDFNEREKKPIVFIGHKPTLSYVLVTVTILSKNNTCTLKARGNAISKAVDVAEITRKKFLSEIVKIASIQIGSEDVTGDRGKRTVSTIEIILEKIE
jgi:DNA-binding protein